MDCTKPKITLLISTYNWKEALRLCLMSASVQTIMPDEIIIADDGSREDTRQLVKEFEQLLPIPIIHVWHEDNGFRVGVIRNKSIAQASGDYIIQIDGDVIMERHFIHDHIKLMEVGYFVCGSRTKLDLPASNKLLSNVSIKLNPLKVKTGFILNSLRCKIARNFLAKRYAKVINHLRGCNMAYWKADLIAVNGYNEDLLEWGHEDGELAYRLHFRGIKKKALKMGGIVYHLWHKEHSKHNEEFHLITLKKVIQNQLTWCENGINKYLNTKKSEE